MAKDAPNPDDYFGPGASAPAATPKRAVNPDDYFGKVPEPEPPKRGVIDAVVDGAKSLGEAGSEPRIERPAGERRGGNRREAAKPYVGGESLAAGAAAAEKMAPGQVALTDGVKPGPGHRTAVEPAGARQAYSSGRQPYEDRRAAVDDAVDMIEGGVDRQKVYDQFMKGPAGITQFEIDTRGHALGGPQFTADRRQVEVRPGALNGEMSRRDPGLGENLANFGARAKETVGRTTDVLANEAGLMGNEATANRIAARTKKIDAAMPALENLEGQAAISAAGKEGFGPALAAMRENPTSFFTMLADSMAQSLPISLVAGTLGAVAGGPAGAAAGAYAGSGAQEYASALVDAISAGGRDPRNPVDVLAALNDPKLMADARARGVKRGLVVGAFDALSAGLAGKFMLPVVKAIESGAAVGGKAVRAAGVASAKETGMQAGLGMAGEAGGSVAAGDKINAADVLMEGFAEIPGGIPEAAGNIRHERKNPNSQIAGAIDTSADLWGRYFAGKPDTPDAKGFTKPQAPTVVLKESLNRFDELAAAFGLSPAAAAAVREQAGGKPAGDVPGFLARVTDALNRRGLFQRPVDDAGVQQLDEAINGVRPPPAAPSSDQQVKPPAAAPDAPLDAGSLLGTPIDEGAHGAATSPTNDIPEPTDAQKKAGNYQVGRVKLGGLDISIENPQGSVRRGVDEDGNAWENTLQHHYGYVRGTVGADGDHVDAFIKPGTPEDYAGPVFVVDQRHPDGTFDEHKVLLGFDSPQEAEAAYRSNYAADWDGLGYLSGMDMPAFQGWIKTGNHKQPFSAGFKERPSADRPNVAVPPAVATGPGAAGGAVPGGSGGTVGSQPGGGGTGLVPAADAPVPGGGTTVPAGVRAKPNTALSDTPDYEATYPRPLGGKNSQFDGLEDDEPTLSKAVAGVHKQAADAIATSLKAARAAAEAGDKSALGEALTEVDGTLGEYADEFGPENAKAFQAKVAPDLETLRAGTKVATVATPDAGAPVQADSGSAAPAPAAPAPGPVLQNRDRSTPGAITQMKGIAAAPDYTRLGFSRDFTAGAPVVAGGSIPETQLGRKDTTAAGSRKIPVQYAVVEAGDVLASNDSDGVVNKDYGTAVDRIRAIAGNGRIAGLQGAYAGKKADAYRAEMEDDTLHGIDPAVIAGMKAPVLVRVMPTSEISDDIGDVSNIAPGLGFNATETAKNDARRVNMAGLEFTEAGDPTPQSVIRFVQAMPESEQGTLIQKTGAPSRPAIDRFNAAIFWAAYESESLVSLYAEATTDEARNVMSALAQAAPSMARLAGAGALDIRDLVAQAAELAVNARRLGIKLSDQAAQSDMSADPDVAPILTLFAGSAKSVKPIVEALRRAADFAYDEATKDGTDMFGTVERATRADVLDQLRTPGERGRQETLEDPRRRQPDGQDAVGRGAGPGRPGAPGRPEGSRPAQDDAQGAATPEGARPDLTLEAPTPEGLRAIADRQAAADAADAAEQKRLADKARADAEGGDFVLTGSDRPADVGAANGQSDIFGAPEPAPAPDPFADNFTAFDGKTVEQTVPIDGGGTATLRMDAGKALRRLDERQQALDKLKLCLGGKS